MLQGLDRDAISLLRPRNEMLFFTSLLSVSWLLVLGCAVTRASSQPDDPAVISPRLIAAVLFEPPAQRSRTHLAQISHHS